MVAAERPCDSVEESKFNTFGIRSGYDGTRNVADLASYLFEDSYGSLSFPESEQESCGSGRSHGELMFPSPGELIGVDVEKGMPEAGREVGLCSSQQGTHREPQLPTKGVSLLKPAAR